MSYITAESRFLVDLYGRGQRTKDATGAALFGPDSSAWPAWWFDAVAVLEVQRILEANARHEIEMEELKNSNGAH